MKGNPVSLTITRKVVAMMWNSIEPSEALLETILKAQRDGSIRVWMTKASGLPTGPWSIEGEVLDLFGTVTVSKEFLLEYWSFIYFIEILGVNLAQQFIELVGKPTQYISISWE